MLFIDSVPYCTGENMGLMYTSIRVKNMKKSLTFYSKYLGLKVVGRREPIPDELVVSLEDKSTKQKLNLMWYGKNCKMYTPWKEDGVELDHLMFNVNDAKKEYKAMVKRGMKTATELFEHEREGKKVTMGFVKDPNGIWVGFRSEA
jgi:catechol 2,3-dioxygenase-like lactoylglutathione lyase family enzyme